MTHPIWEKIQEFSQKVHTLHSAVRKCEQDFWKSQPRDMQDAVRKDCERKIKDRVEQLEGEIAVEIEKKKEKLLQDLLEFDRGGRDAQSLPPQTGADLSMYNICGDRALHTLVLSAYKHTEGSPQRKALMSLAKKLIEKSETRLENGEIEIFQDTKRSQKSDGDGSAQRYTRASLPVCVYVYTYV